MGPPLPWWWKIELKKISDIFSSIHASKKLLYSLCFSKYMKMVNSTCFYGHGTTTFAHKVLISTTFVTQSFDLKMTYFRCRHSWQKCYFLDANYSIKHKRKVLLECVLQKYMSLRIQNLKKNWILVHKQRCYSHFCKGRFKQKYSHLHLRWKSLLFRCKLLNKTIL